MKQYIGSKIVQAEPAYRFTGVKPDYKAPGQIGNEETIALLEDSGWEIIDKEEGYKVRYEDGYESWSPKEAFEAAYRQTDGMSFGLALEATKKGMRIARAGWNGKGMYVFLVHGMDFHTNADLSELDDQDVEVLDCLVIRTATGAFCPGWLASQTDMLADDWMVVE